MTYPEYAEVAGVRYKINTDFRVALKCFEVIEDDEIGDEERAYAVIFLLFGVVPTENLDDWLRICGDYLRCGEPDKGNVQADRDMDFTYDEKYIVASFMSDYHIDLSRVEMHFWLYIQLIQGLTEHCALSRVRELRNYDLSEIKDPKERAKMSDAKESVALPVKLSRADRDAIEEFENLFS